MKNQVMLIAVLCAVALCPKPAQAYLITIQIEAVVDSVEDNGPGDGYLDGQIHVGDMITGYYTYESTTLDSSTLDYRGIYEHYLPPCGIFLNVSGFDFETDPAHTDFVIDIIDNLPGYEKDSYLIYSNNNLPLSNGTIVEDIGLRFTDSSGQALSSTALPLTAPNLDDWLSPYTLVISGGFSISSNVTSMVLIPEPASVLLLAFGFVFIQHKRKKNHKFQSLILPKTIVA